MYWEKAINLSNDLNILNNKIMVVKMLLSSIFIVNTQERITRDEF